MFNCVLHPKVESKVDAMGIPVCDDCYDRYRVERGRSNGDFKQRPFLQSLINARHGLKGTESHGQAKVQQV